MLVKRLRLEILERKRPTVRYWIFQSKSHVFLHSLTSLHFSRDCWWIQPHEFSSGKRGLLYHSHSMKKKMLIKIKDHLFKYIFRGQSTKRSKRTRKKKDKCNFILGGRTGQKPFRVTQKEKDENSSDFSKGKEKHQFHYRKKQKNKKKYPKLLSFLL